MCGRCTPRRSSSATSASHRSPGTCRCSDHTVVLCGLTPLLLSGLVCCGVAQGCVVWCGAGWPPGPRLLPPRGDHQGDDRPHGAQARRPGAPSKAQGQYNARPIDHFTNTPIHHLINSPIHHCTIPPVQHFTNSPFHQFISSQMFNNIISPFHQYISSPLIFNTSFLPRFSKSSKAVRDCLFGKNSNSSGSSVP